MCVTAKDPLYYNPLRNPLLSGGFIGLVGKKARRLKKGPFLAVFWHSRSSCSEQEDRVASKSTKATGWEHALSNETIFSTIRCFFDIDTLVESRSMPKKGHF